MKSIGFVCYGNACRSIMAEAIMSLWPGRFKIYSAGLHPLGRVPKPVIKIIESQGINISSLYSKGLNEIPIKELDFLIVLDPYVSISKPVLTFLEGIKPQTITWDVEDPYGKGKQDHLRVFNFLKEKIECFLKEFDTYSFSEQLQPFRKLEDT